MAEFERADTAVGFIDTDYPGIHIGFDINGEILAFEFIYKEQRHTIWLGLKSGVTVIERDRDQAEIFRGNLNDTHRSTYRGGVGASQESGSGSPEVGDDPVQDREQ